MASDIAIEDRRQFLSLGGKTLISTQAAWVEMRVFHPAWVEMSSSKIFSSLDIVLSGGVFDPGWVEQTTFPPSLGRKESKMIACW